MIVNGLRVLFLKESLDSISEWICEVVRKCLNKKYD